ncbi:hypothetical protein [Neobacillus piezotolerans]|nr:hypothetical protein [Neobacillus piezotolerans]
MKTAADSIRDGRCFLGPFNLLDKGHTLPDRCAAVRVSSIPATAV